MEKMDRFYEKFHGSYFAFIGVVIFLTGFVIAALVEPNFSFFETFISDLGAPTNTVYIFFNICWFITGIFMIFFLLFFTRYLQKHGGGRKETWITFISSFISAIGIMLLSIFNKIDSPDMHLISEYIFFFSGILYLILYTIIEFRIPEFSKFQAILNLIVAFFFVLYLILLILNRINPGLSPELQTFTEWLFLFATLFWFVENGVYALKR